MGVVQFATTRRVTVLMLMVTMVLFGAISLRDLDVNLLPDLSYPTLTVRTEYRGAAPAEMETLVTRPVEEALGVVKRVKRVVSVSRSGQSDVILEFSWGTDMEIAGLDVREKLEILQLPVEAGRPKLLRFNPSTDPILRAALSVSEVGFDEVALKRLRRFADEVIKKRIESVDGVAAVKISGGLEDEIEVAVDQQHLAQLNLSLETIVQRLRGENINLSGGRLRHGNQRLLVRTENQFTDLKQIRRIIIPTDSGPRYLEELATVTHAFKERQAIIRLDGREAVEIAIYKEGDANTIKVADAAKRRLDKIAEDLPEEMAIALRVVEDQSLFINSAIGEVVQGALLGGLLAVLVIYLFLGQARATGIIAATIPVSILAGFVLRDRAGVTLNIMSLGGIALAVGLLVDNSIVVLESIARLRQQGLDLVEATRRGAAGVAGAVTASTLTTIAVFVPLVFVEGIGGQLFHDQALTVTFALLASLLVAMTLIPMLSSLQLRHTLHRSRDLPNGRVRRGAWWLFWRAPLSLVTVIVRLARFVSKIAGGALRPAVAVTGHLFAALERGYGRLLPWALGQRTIVLLLAALALGSSLALVPRLGVELIPQMVQDRFDISLRLSAGSALDATDGVVQQLQALSTELPEIEYTFSVSGSGNRLDADPVDAGEHVGALHVAMKSGSGAVVERKVMERLRSRLDQMPGVQAQFDRPALFSFDTPLEVVVSGYDLETLRGVADQVATELKGSRRFVDVRSSLEQGQPEVRILFDQERLAAFDLTVRKVADRVVKKLRGDVATRYSYRDRKIDVLVRVSEDARGSVQDIGALIVNPASERPVTLDSVARVVATVGPAEVRRVDQERVAVVSANLRFGGLGAAAGEAQDLLDSIGLPSGIEVEIAGQGEEMAASFDSLRFALGLAIFLVYLVMASQFESLRNPLVILLSIPLAAVGAIVALLLTDTRLSVVVMIGMIMLAGIVVNNAIVLVDLMTRPKNEGRSTQQAIIVAGRERLRPILMTTATTVLGMLPLAIGLGEGSEVRAPMAITVIGGLLGSTVLTLVVIPVIYALFNPQERVLTEAVEVSE